MGKTLNSGRKPHAAMPKSKQELVDLLNSGPDDYKFNHAFVKLGVSKVTLTHWMKHFGIKRIVRYE